MMKLYLHILLFAQMISGLIWYGQEQPWPHLLSVIVVDVHYFCPLKSIKHTVLERLDSLNKPL